MIFESFLQQGNESEELGPTLSVKAVLERPFGKASEPNIKSAAVCKASAAEAFGMLLVYARLCKGRTMMHVVGGIAESERAVGVRSRTLSNGARSPNASSPAASNRRNDPPL